MEFLPEWSSMEIKGRYRPLFKLFANSGWKYVRRNGKPVECDTAAQAISEAKDCVKRILNPAIRSEQIEQAPALDALADEVQAFLERREQAAEKEKVKVFGEVGPSTVFLRGGRQVQVEHRQRKRA
jgi:hypothetical protein